VLERDRVAAKRYGPDHVGDDQPRIGHSRLAAAQRQVAVNRRRPAGAADSNPEVAAADGARRRDHGVEHAEVERSLRREIQHRIA
jgi:hypothetical protein